MTTMMMALTTMTMKMTMKMSALSSLQPLFSLPLAKNSDRFHSLVMNSDDSHFMVMNSSDFLSLNSLFVLLAGSPPDVRQGSLLSAL